MIADDQPDCFPSELVVAVSSKDDGTLLDTSTGVHHPDITARRQTFCANNGVHYRDVVYQRILYGDTETYDSIAEVGEHDTTQHTNEVHADALVTEAPGVGLFLPVADCVATVIYDPACHRLALLHLGRHSSVAQLMAKTLEYIARKGTNPADCIVWMAPSAQQSHYRMEYFEYQDEPAWRSYCEQREDGIYLDLQGYNTALAVAEGVRPENIHRSPINTATHDAYFSHSQGDVAGRFAVVAARVQ